MNKIYLIKPMEYTHGYQLCDKKWYGTSRASELGWTTKE